MSGKQTQRQSTAIAGGVFVCLLPVGCQAATKGSDRQSVHQIVWPTQNSPVSMICVRNRTKCKRKQKTSKETCIGGVIYCSALLPPPRVLRSSCVHTVSLGLGGKFIASAQLLRLRLLVWPSHLIFQGTLAHVPSTDLFVFLSVPQGRKTQRQILVSYI